MELVVGVGPQVVVAERLLAEVQDDGVVGDGGELVVAVAISATDGRVRPSGRVATNVR